MTLVTPSTVSLLSPKAEALPGHSLFTDFMSYARVDCDKRQLPYCMTCMVIETSLTGLCLSLDIAE